ncbi:MAG: cupin domain-containing protein [Pseudobacteriovorax sp.]|nr:cupin domain-containing protein [Pseudobacteriovorax sp.]
MDVKTLKNEYVVANPEGKAQILKSDDFWRIAFDKGNPANHPKMGYLMSQFSFEKDWDTWERHPNGDEIVFCTSGHITLVLDSDKGHESIELEQGQYIVVPQNTWHTAKVKKLASAVFLTWGFGTETRNIDQT